MDTGKKEKVAGYNAKIYTLDEPGEKVKLTYWISKDVPYYAAVQKCLRKLGRMPDAAAQEKDYPDPSKIDGMEVKTVVVMEINGKTTSATTTLVSIKREAPPPPDSDFVIPEGYKITGFD